MELVVAQTLAGERVDGRHVDRAAEGARLAETHIVEQNDQHIGRIGRRFRLEAWWRGGVARVEGGDRRVCRFRDRKDRPVHSHPFYGEARLRQRA